MRRVAFICVLVVFLGVALADETYSDKFDGLDLDAVLPNERLLGTYIKCLKLDDDSECNAEGKELKRVLTEALTTDCAKCTDKQKIGTEKVIRFLYINYREVLERLLKKFDPSGSFLQKHPDYKQ